MGSVIIGMVSDRSGRRMGVLLSCGIVALCGLASVVAPNFATLVVLRAGVGFGVSGTSASLSLFTEMVPAAVRSDSLIYFMAFFSAGSALEVVLAWAAEVIGGGWRLLLFLSVIPAILAFGLTAMFLPESPRFLLLAGRKHEAVTQLREIMEVNGVPEAEREEELEKQLSEMMASLGDGGSSPGTPPVNSETGLTLGGVLHQGRKLIGPLFQAELRVTSVILCSLFCLMAVVYYGLVFITVLSFDGSSSTDSSSSNQPSSSSPGCQSDELEYLPIFFGNLAELPGLFLAMGILDRLGRKNSLILLFLLTAVTVPLLGFPFPAPMMTLLIFVCRAFSLGFNQSLWIYTTEIYPTWVRATGVGFCSSFARVGGMLSPLIAQLLFAESRLAAVSLVSLMSMACALLVYHLPHETKGRILQ